MRKAREVHGWRSSRNWGFYPSWRFGAWKHRGLTADGKVEVIFVLAIGPFYAMWDKLEARLAAVGRE